MRTYATLFALTIAVTGCGQQSTSAITARVPSSDGKGTASQGTTRRPMKGTCEATPSGPPVVTPPTLRQPDTGTCQLSHLGATTLHAVRVSNLATGALVIEIEFTAANGDVLRGTNVGTGTPSGPNTIRFVGTTTIAGGTGRFANATGEWQSQGTADLVTGKASFTYDGWIVYDASGGAS